MVKHTQTIRQQKPTNCLNVFDHSVRLALKLLIRLIDFCPALLSLESLTKKMVLRLLPQMVPNAHKIYQVAIQSHVHHFFKIVLLVC